jgi:copper chaperone CopZ
MKIRVISDGVHHTVIDEDTGNDVPGVASVDVNLSPNALARVDLHMVALELRVRAEIVPAVEKLRAFVAMCDRVDGINKDFREPNFDLKALIEEVLGGAI